MAREIRKAVLLCITVAALPLMAQGTASAQTVRDAVKGHVDKELDRPKPDRDEENRDRDRQDRRGQDRRGQDRSRRSATDPDTREGSGTPITIGLMDDQELVNPLGPKLPIRIFPGISNLLRLDLKFDSAYRGWLPQQYSSADVDVASYLTWSVAVKGKFFKYVTLHRGSYESNGLSSPRNKKASVAALVGKHVPKAAKALAYIGFPIFKTIQPIIRYETRAFSTSASPKIPVCIVDFESSADLDLATCPKTTNRLSMISSYETLVAGIRITPDIASTSMLATRKAKLPPL